MADPFAIIASYGQQGNAGDAFSQSFQQGQVNNRQNLARSAMAALAQDPNNPRALAALAQADPQTAMEFRRNQVEVTRQQLAQHQDSILKGAEILRQFNPKDQASYSAAIAAAQQAGVDISQVPQQYNPQYVDGVIHIADALKPQTENDVVNIPYQAGGGVVQYDKRTHQVTPLIVPNPGDAAPGAPVSSGPPPEAVSYLRAHPELSQHFDEKYGAGSAARLLGGSTAPAPSSHFP